MSLRGGQKVRRGILGTLSTFILFARYWGIGEIAASKLRFSSQRRNLHRFFVIVTFFLKDSAFILVLWSYSFYIIYSKGWWNGMWKGLELVCKWVASGHFLGVAKRFFFLVIVRFKMWLTYSFKRLLLIIGEKGFFIMLTMLNILMKKIKVRKDSADMRYREKVTKLVKRIKGV